MDGDNELISEPKDLQGFQNLAGLFNFVLLKLLKIFLHIVLPVIIGTMIYVFGRTGNYFFAQFLPSINNHAVFIKLPTWVKYNLPDGLWFYALLSTLIFIWGQKFSPQLFAWILFVIVLSILTEILQAYHFMPGTFDWMDLLAYFIAAVFCLFHFHSITNQLLLIFKSKSL